MVEGRTQATIRAQLARVRKITGHQNESGVGVIGVYVGDCCQQSVFWIETVEGTLGYEMGIGEVNELQHESTSQKGLAGASRHERRLEGGMTVSS